MKRINDKALLESYLKRFGIPELFEQKDIVFELHEYEKGEILNSKDNAKEYVQFLVEGSVAIYHVRYDGELSKLCLLDRFGFLGDIELCGNIKLPLLIEAHSDIICVNMSLIGQLEKIMNDNRFLRFIANSLAEKLAIFVRLEVITMNLEERVIGYLKNETKDGTFKGVETMAVRIRCSRRQLQRVLKSMVEKGILIKEKKGQYRLIKED